MVCINCGGGTAVTNSRHQKRSNSIWRRRKCQDCSNIFTSTEIIELSGSIMVKDAAGRLIPFSRDVLFISVYQSCKHRPEAISDAGALTQIIVDDLLRDGVNAPIPCSIISKTASTIIQRLDPVAATFYKAYHPNNKPSGKKATS